MFSEPYQIPAHLRAVLAPGPSLHPAQTGQRLAGGRGDVRDFGHGGNLGHGGGAAALGMAGYLEGFTRCGPTTGLHGSTIGHRGGWRTACMAAHL